jgi:hypothetical protein
MPEELGRIDKPEAEEFRGERKLLFVPLLFGSDESPAAYIEKLERYWEQVSEQLRDLEAKLGSVSHVYHEMTAVGGEEGCTTVKDLNQQSHEIVSGLMERGAQLEPLESADLLTELMDWSRCLAVGLQNEKVFKQAYEAYVTVNHKRNEQLAEKISETLKSDEVGVLLMREGHQVQFPADIQVFYVAPPTLDEIKRWLRDQESARRSKKPDEGTTQKGATEEQ